MWYLILKILISAVLIGLISEVSQRSTLLGGLLAAVPLTSILAIIWLYVDTKDKVKVIELSNSIFWLVLPTLSFFIIFPILLKKINFEFSLILSLGVMAVISYAMVFILSKFGIAL